MDAKGTFVYCLLILSLTTAESFFVISDKIWNDTEFYYRTLSVYPSKLATIEYTVNFNICSECKVKLHIYTTDRDIKNDIASQCHNRKYGQLRNENLHIPLSARLHPYRSTTCIFNKTDQTVYCNGKTTIQDFKPRNYAFSFGFDCGRYSKPPSLNGLSFYVSIYGQQNKSKCVPYSEGMDNPSCWNFYDHVSLPNLIGDPDLKSVKKWIGRLDAYELYMASILPPESKGLCYQHTYEILCRVAVPKCDPVRNQVIHPCQQICYDVIQGCSKYILNMQDTLSLPLQKKFKHLKSYLEKDIQDYVGCDYLPSRNGSIPCYYKPVTCGAPPNVTNAFTDLIGNKSYAVDTQIQYSCVNESYRIDGENISTCMYSGQWSKTPRCVLASQKADTGQNGDPLKIVLPLLIILFVVFFVLCLVLRCRKQKKEELLTRIRKYDAFVCYDYGDDDRIFAEETLRMKFEENHNPPLKLCLHRRDFQAAWDIMWNIRNSITNSNSVIIIMSQAYVNSLWCREEFEQCYMENMKDPAFKLFVIMMQPENELVNTSEYMESFFRRKTYLEQDDPKLITKIADYLTRVKQPKENKRNVVHNNHENDDLEEQVEMQELL